MVLKLAEKAWHPFRKQIVLRTSKLAYWRKGTSLFVKISRTSVRFAAPAKYFILVFLITSASSPTSQRRANAFTYHETEQMRENTASMARMMAAMEVRSSGDTDTDFVAMMIPHHQGAIDMAMTELKYGRNEHLRRIAQGIIINQQQEIATMRFALDRSLPASTGAPTHVAPADTSSPSPRHHHQMLKEKSR